MQVMLMVRESGAGMRSSRGKEKQLNLVDLEIDQRFTRGSLGVATPWKPFRRKVQMQHKSFGDQQCPIARSLERVGEWWSILILRDAFLGLTRFDQFQKNLDIAPNMLTRRLNALVESGLLERRRYSDKPPRYEYILTERGRDFRPVLWSLLAWGNKHFAPEGPSVVLVDAETGAAAEPMLVDRVTGRPLTPPEFRTAPGPAADEDTRRQHTFPRSSETASPAVGQGGTGVGRRSRAPGHVTG